MLEEDFNELILYISELKEQYHIKIDEQSQRINDQMMIIDELCSQVRELGSRVRSLTAKIENKSEFCVCNYENHSFKKYGGSERSYSDRSRLNEATVNGSDDKFAQKQRWQEDLDEYDVAVDDITKKNEENIYEAIESLSIKTIPKVCKNSMTPQCSNNNIGHRSIDKRKESNTERRLIQKNVNQSATGLVIDSSLATAEDDGNPERLKIKKTQAHKDLQYLDDEHESTYEDVELRVGPYKSFGPNSQRGSSKVACSLASDLDIEYWTNSQESLDEGKGALSTHWKSLKPTAERTKSLMETMKQNSQSSQNRIQSGIWMRSKGTTSRTSSTFSEINF